MKNRRIFAVLAILVVILIPILVGAYFRSNTDPNSFRIVILDRDIDTTRAWLGSEIETAWPILLNAYPSKEIHEINVSDIERYNWKNQTILLTSEASRTFVERFPTCAKTGTYSPGECLTNYHFLTMVKEKPIYGGIILNGTPIATAYNFPILYIQWKNGKIQLILRPYNTLTLTENDFSKEDWRVIKDEGIWQLFFLQGRIVE